MHVIREFDYMFMISVLIRKKRMKIKFQLIYFYLSLGDITYKNVRRMYNLGLNGTDYVNVLKVSWRYKSQMST